LSRMSELLPADQGYPASPGFKVRGPSEIAAATIAPTAAKLRALGPDRRRDREDAELVRAERPAARQRVAPFRLAGGHWIQAQKLQRYDCDRLAVRSKHATDSNIRMTERGGSQP
jgi:hypothetical protein